MNARHHIPPGARIVELAAPGEVITSEATRRAADKLDSVTFEPVGPAVMKGIPPIPAVSRVARGLGRL